MQDEGLRLDKYDLIAKTLDFQGFPGVETKKNSSLDLFQTAVSDVEVAGFEPAAFWSRTKRATKLRYTSEMLTVKVSR